LTQRGLSETVAEDAERVAGAGRELRQQSQTLDQVVSRFRLE
jgi:methyl-accepting chemotaxis protein